MSLPMPSGKVMRFGIKLISFYVLSVLLIGIIIVQVMDLLSTGARPDKDTLQRDIQNRLLDSQNGRDIYAGAWGPSRGLQYHPKLAVGTDVQYKVTEVSIADHGPEVDFVETSSDCCNSAGTGSRIFILAAMRTGSSFLGEIFAQRRDFFYLFEPGKYLADHIESQNLSRRVLITRYLQLIEDVYRCDFSNSKVLTDGLSNETTLGKKRFAPALLRSNGCRRKGNELKRGKLVCDQPFPVSEITNACKSRPHVGIKAIRIPDLNLLLHLMRRSKTNLKVIHLVRDPRGMVVSRLRVHAKDRLPEGMLYNVSHITETVRYYVQRYCLSWATNIEIGKYIPSVSSNYKLVRYEDLARDPVGHTHDIYSFVGLGSKIPSEVYRWIVNNTGMNQKLNQSGSSKPYSTSRNSRETFEAWRKSVRYDFIHFIQSIGDCRKLMNLAGYLHVPDEQALRDPARSFVTNIPKFNLTKYEIL